MRSLFAGVVALLVFPPVGAGHLCAAVFDLKNDWSDTANPHGVWSYNEGAIPLPHQDKLESVNGLGPGPQPGWGPSDGTTNPRIPFWFQSVYSRPVVAQGPDQATADWMVGDVITHSQDDSSGAGEGPCNVTFTNPTACIADVSGCVWMARDIGRQVDWGLYLNDNLLTAGSVFSGDPFDRAEPFYFAAGSGGAAVLHRVPLQAGDLLKLHLTNYGRLGDFVGVNFTIETEFARAQWASAGSGNWNDLSKWTGGVPNAIGAEAAFSVSTTSAATVTLDAPVTLGTLQFGNSGNTNVGYTLSGGGANTLTLNNSGSGATITVTDGTHAINAPIVLADNLVVTSGGTSPWALNVGPVGSISQSGTESRSLTMNGSGGMLVLTSSNVYTGPTTVSAGTLSIGPSGSIHATSGISIGPMGTLQVTAGGGGCQLPSVGNFTLAGGTFSYGAGSYLSPGETVGTLMLTPGHSQVVANNTGSGMHYLRFAAGTAHTIGATVGFSVRGSQIAFLSNPPALSNKVLPYAYYGPVDGSTVDFATLVALGGLTQLAPLTYSSSMTGNVGLMGPDGSLNVMATGGQSSLTKPNEFNSLKLVGPASITMIGDGSLTLHSGGLLSTGSSTAISGGAIWAPGGELNINTDSDLMISSVISTSAALVKTGTATLTLTATYPIDGDIFINQGTLDYAPEDSVNYVHTISGVGRLRMSGPGTLTLTGTNSYTGGTSITAGILKMGNSAALGTGGVTMTGGTLDVGSLSSLDISSIACNGGVILNSASGACGLTASPASGSTTLFSGSLTDGDGVVGLTLPSTAAGRLVLSGSNSFSGGTTVEGGTLVVTIPAALPDLSSLTIGANAASAFGSAVGSENATGIPEPIPEPSMFALLGVSAIGIAAFTWRRRK